MRKFSRGGPRTHSAWQTDAQVRYGNGTVHHHTEFLVSVSVGETCQGDLDGNGQVDLGDLAIMLSLFGSICP